MATALRTRLLRLLIRLLVKPGLSPRRSIRFQRRWTALLDRVTLIPSGVETEVMRAGEIELERVRWLSAGGGAERAKQPAVLHAHSGGFMVGTLRAHRALATRLSRESGADVYVADYRLAPEHPYPAPVDDLFAAYELLLERGHDPARVAIVGESAGAALAVSTALAIAEMDRPAPAALVLISPFVDLELTGASIRERARRDPMLTPGWLRQGAAAHAGSLAPSDPRISPLYAELRGLPPTLIQVGEEEILLDDAVRLADRAWGAGVEVELERFPGLWHTFQLHGGILISSDEALADIAAFLRRRWGEGVEADQG